MKPRSLVLLLLLSVGAVTASGKKNRTWRIGTLVSSQEQSAAISNVITEQGDTPGLLTGGSYDRRRESYERADVWQEYVIEWEGSRYVITQPLRWRWSKPALVTAGDSVWFSVEARDVYLLDETGKEYKMELLQRIADPSHARSVPNFINGAQIRAEASKPRPAMTNLDVIRLKNGGISDALLLQKIKGSRPGFRLDTDGLLELKKAGISDFVISAMLKAINGN